MVAQILEDYQRAYGLQSICVRYFNAAGADSSGELGERHEPETHLIPLVLRAASGRASEIKVFGRDYDTADGTCIRDYVHVVDLFEAHRLALERLMKNGGSGVYNLGNGNGFSVAEVIAAAKRVTQRAIRVTPMPRREGDPARLVADASLARNSIASIPSSPMLGRGRTKQLTFNP